MHLPHQQYFNIILSLKLHSLQKKTKIIDEILSTDMF